MPFVVTPCSQVGTRIPVYVHKNPDFRLPASPSTPIIMVGPGTGLAPFRSFILERMLQQEQQGAKPGPMVLYFGCRRRDQDYLYGNVLEGWAADGKVTLYTAFSREQVGAREKQTLSTGMRLKIRVAERRVWCCGARNFIFLNVARVGRRFPARSH